MYLSNKSVFVITYQSLRIELLPEITFVYYLRRSNSRVDINCFEHVYTENKEMNPHVQYK
jgi:hypothetical protein